MYNLKKFISIFLVIVSLTVFGCSYDTSESAIKTAVDSKTNSENYLQNNFNNTIVAIRKDNIYYIPKGYKFVSYNSKTRNSSEKIIYRKMREQEFPETYTIQDGWDGEILTVVEAK